jgi:hypothetical protein
MRRNDPKEGKEKRGKRRGDPLKRTGKEGIIKETAGQERR